VELFYGDPQPNIDKQAEFAILPAWIQKAISLYNRCRMFNEIALPCNGGVIDQDEMTVVVLQRIYQKHNEIIADRMEQQMRHMKERDNKAVDNIQIGKSYWARRD